MAERIRSFIAVEIREQTILDQLLKDQDLIRRSGADVKLVEPQNIHVTLRFLGEILQSQLAQIMDSLNQLSFTGFEVELKGLGAFPSLKHMNVIWVGISRGAQELANLSKEIEPKVRAAGVPSDKKGFSPHITIARVRSHRGREQLIQIISEKGDEGFGTMVAESIVLKKSVLLPHGPVYSNVHEVKANAT